MDKLGRCTSRHVRTLSLVVTAVDDFTGSVIMGSQARVWIEGEKPPIKKPEGWYVFLDLPAGEYTVLAEGGFYNRSSCVCTIEDGNYKNIKIRLTPGRNAPLEAGTCCIEGSTDPKTAVCIRPADRSLSYKLLTDVSAGADSIGIYHPDGIDIEGKLFCIVSEGKEEFIRVSSVEKGSRLEYRLHTPLVGSYPKIGTLIYPVSESCADEKGKFFVPVRGIPEKTVEFICTRTEEPEKRCTFALTMGNRVRIEV